MQPLDSAALALLQRQQQDSLSGFLGMEFVQVQADHMIVRMPISERVRQPFGILHGGATVALAETAASIGTWMGIDQTLYHAVGLEINCNHLRPTPNGVITADAKPLHRGRTTWVWDIRVTNEAGQLVAISRCTIAVVPQSR